MKSQVFISAFALLFVLAACNQPQGKKHSDTATSGSVSIAVDETFAPIIQEELDVFHHLYPDANVTANFKPEGEVILDLINDSARIAIVTRDLTEQERKTFDQINLTVIKKRFAIDAIALIVNPENKDTTISMPQVRELFAGKIPLWSDLKKGSPSDSIIIVFDNPKSSTVRYMAEIAGYNKFSSSSNFYAMQTNKDVINYVSKHKNAIGIIGVNWISDFDDQQTQLFLKEIKVMAVAPDRTEPGAGEYRKPYQAYIKEGTYPLVRDLYILNREARMGLGTGFSAFIMGDKGQRIVLKSGLLPATMPTRLVNINNK